MRIQHNIMAMNAYRNYNNNTSSLSKNLEKLSSGYKINRAGDDAAGLAISEKMRAQITGLDAAQKNVKDGISLVKTAEGAMQEIQDMLNRMDYLATQSANGTYDNEVDRANLQKEVAALKTEIDRIADSANFNGIKLMDGSLAVTEAVEASSTTTVNDIDGMDRIIKSVIGEGEKAYEVQGKKTILDTTATATSAVRASFSLDLSTLNFSCSGSGSISAKVTLSIGGTDITVTATGIKASATSSAIAQAIASKIAKSVGSKGIDKSIQGIKASTGSNTVRINGVDWTVKASAGKLTFTQSKDPTTRDEARANFDVNIKFEAAKGEVLNISDDFNQTLTTEKKLNVAGSTNSGTYVSKAGVATEDLNKANTVFNIREEDIKDGTQIAIGSVTVILKVGPDSSITKASSSYGSNVKIVTLDKDDDLYTALCKISNKVGSTVNLYRISASGARQTIAFSLGVSDGKNGNVIGLTLQRTDPITGKDGVATNAFLSVEELAKNFKMKVTTTTNVEAKEAQSGLTLQIGDTSDKFNQMKVTVGDMHVSAMGKGKAVLDGKEIEVTKTIADIDISTQEGAAEAVQVIKNAINYVSGVRGDLGAVQNRLEHTQNNLSVMAENIQDAESTIRDTDVAAEMMSYVKNNILVQSAQAMLAQANQVPQGVLQLLG